VDPVTLAAVIGGGVSLAQNIWGAKRQDSAHRREVRDLVGAGINPIHSAGGQGAPSQPMDDVARGATSAMAVARARAELRLLDSQANREDATAVLARTQAADVSSSAAGRYDLTAVQAQLGRMNVEQLRQQLPLLQKRMLEEIRLTKGSADAKQVEAMLLRLDLTRASNQEAFEKRLGELGPASRFFLEALSRIGRLR